MRRLLLAFVLVCLGFTASAMPHHEFRVADGCFTLDGEPFVIKAAELHYPRIPREYWRHRIRMSRALGMNTICLYVFWNLHEPREGEFDFSGDKDVAEFCRIAMEEGMWVILRPGPYVCAEWEMGGLPWWLLKDKDIELRTSDPRFMKRVESFEREVGRQLAPLTVEHGGPIIMVQVENEYGSYGVDKAYISAIRDVLRRSGFDKAVLFQCDWSSNFTLNGLDDLLWTLNFGTGADIDAQFAELKSLRPETPLMCSEFWSGWFDKWGANHETRPADAMVEGIDEMLQKDISFSLYMTHGGTSFGHWAGANSPGFAPDVTSYDYDAPIDEAGRPTAKYDRLRNRLKRHSPDPLPAIPDPISVIAIDNIVFDRFAPVEAGVDSIIHAESPLTFEEMDFGWGSAIYTTRLPSSMKTPTLTITEPHDYCIVSLNGRRIATIDRVKGQNSISLPDVAVGDTLSIFVEAMGRINFGRAIKDFKGITDAVTLTSPEETSLTLNDWAIARIPDEYGLALKALATKGTDLPRQPAPGFYHATFTLDNAAGDTYLDVSTLGKGLLWLNGHPLGRFWKIGPQQTLYAPGCWLKKGKNEIIVFDVEGPTALQIKGLTAPVLDRLQCSEEPAPEAPTLDPDSFTTINEGTLADTSNWQTVMFDRPAKGRYVCFQWLDTQRNSEPAAIAELYLLDAEGHRLNRDNWRPIMVSDQMTEGNHSADKAFDLQESTFWSTSSSGALPATMIIDLGKEESLAGWQYLPPQLPGAPGAIASYRISLLTE